MTRATLLAALAGILAAGGLAECAAVWAARARTAPRTRPWPRVRALVVAGLRRLGREVGPAAGPRDLAARIEAAGLEAPVADLLAIKTGAALVGLATALPLAPGMPGRLPALFALGVPAAAFLVPDAWLRRRIRRRAAEMERELPDVLDLVRVAVAAGLAPDRALAEVGERHPGVLAAELRRTARRLALGDPAAAAHATLARRAPVPGVAVLCAALGRAARHGAPLGPALAAQAAEARAARARRAAERAAKAAPKIQLVVALLLVPSVLLLVAAALLPSLAGGSGQ